MVWGVFLFLFLGRGEGRDWVVVDLGVFYRCRFLCGCGVVGVRLDQYGAMMGPECAKRGH